MIFEERGAHTGTFGEVVCRERSAVAGISGRAGPAGSVAIGANVRASARLEAFGLICAPFVAR